MFRWKILCFAIIRSCVVSHTVVVNISFFASNTDFSVKQRNKQANGWLGVDKRRYEERRCEAFCCHSLFKTERKEVHRTQSVARVISPIVQMFKRLRIVLVVTFCQFCLLLEKERPFTSWYTKVSIRSLILRSETEMDYGEPRFSIWTHAMSKDISKDTKPTQ